MPEAAFPNARQSNYQPQPTILKGRGRFKNNRKLNCFGSHRRWNLRQEAPYFTKQRAESSRGALASFIVKPRCLYNLLRTLAISETSPGLKMLIELLGLGIVLGIAAAALIVHKLEKRKVAPNDDGSK